MAAGQLPRACGALFAPVAFAALVVALLALATNAADSVPALVMFALVAALLGVVVQEFARGALARRALTGERLPTALGQLVGRNRRRYGGYIVHTGIAVLFLGMARSSAFHQQKDVRLSPGQSFTQGDYRVTYVRPTAKLGADDAGTGAPISFGAVLRVRKGDEVSTLRPSRNFFPDPGPVEGGDRALLRGRGHVRGRRALGPAA